MKKNLKNIVRNISLLAKSNRLTGIWDNIRFQECKKNCPNFGCAGNVSYAV